MAYAFSLATPNDDEALRAVLRDSPLPGGISLSFEREPNYFLANSVMGETQVLVGRDVESQRIVALAARSERAMFLNGREQMLGYLGQARLSGSPNPFVISRGFRFLKALHQAGSAQGYITTIVEENHAARSLLAERPLPHVPHYLYVDRLHTLALFTRPLRPTKLPGGLQVLAGSRTLLPRMVEFLRENGARRQFFPAYNEQDFASQATRGFRIEDFRVAMRGAEIVGVMGLWNQSGWKQTRVRGYSASYKYLRPAWNIAARLARLRTLPNVGQKLRFSYASFVCIQGDDAQVFQVLARTLLRLSHARGDAYLMLGLCERDGLLATARQIPHIDYPSRLYSVAWDEEFHLELDGRAPYVEIATL